MDKYDYMLEGKIIVVRNFSFHGGILDHAWNNGRLCLVIYSDDEYEYVLPMTHSIIKDFKYKYYYIKESDFSVFYEKRIKDSTLKYKHKPNAIYNKNVKGYIDLRHVYKIPVSFRDEIGKINYERFKKVLSKLNYYHHTNSLEETIEKGIVK